MCDKTAAAAKSPQLCPTLCDPRDGSPPGSPVPGILQTRTLEWVAISFSNAWKWKVKVKSLSCVRLFATPWTAAYRPPLSMGFSRQECWSGVVIKLGTVKCKCHSDLQRCSYQVHIRDVHPTRWHETKYPFNKSIWPCNTLDFTY